MTQQNEDGSFPEIPESTPEDGQNNGADKSHYVPSARDILIGPRGGGNAPAQKIIEFPLDVQEWPSRTQIDMDELMMIVRMHAEDQYVEDGYTDYTQNVWLYANLKKSLEGPNNATTLYTQAIGAMGMRRMQERMWDRMSPPGSKSRGPDGNREES